MLGATPSPAMLKGLFMARPKKVEEIDEPAFFVPEDPTVKSERPTIAEGLKSEPPKAEAKAEAFPQYRVLSDSRFVIGGGVYWLKKDQIISCMTHEVDIVLPQIPHEKL